MLSSNRIQYDNEQNITIYSFSDIVNKLKNIDKKKDFVMSLISFVGIEPEFIKKLRKFIESRHNESKYLNADECFKLIQIIS